MPESFNAKPSTATTSEARARWRARSAPARATARSDRGAHEPEVDAASSAAAMRQPSSNEWPSTERFSDALRRSTSVALPKSVPAFSKNLPTWVRWSDGRSRSTQPDDDAARPRARRRAPTTVRQRSSLPEQQPGEQREPGRGRDRAAEVVAPERHAHHDDGDREHARWRSRTPRRVGTRHASRPGEQHRRRARAARRSGCPGRRSGCRWSASSRTPCSTRGARR